MAASSETGDSGRVPVGVPQSGYNVQRNVIDSLPGWAVRTRPLDRNRIVAGVRTRLTGRIRADEQFTFSEPYWPRAALVHMFNSIAATRTPWICSFETMLPRWGDVVLPDWDVSARSLQRAVAMMRADSCKRLLAMSDAARRLLVRRWRMRLSPSDADHLESKIEVLYPPQAVIARVDERIYGTPPRFVFVGAEFYRKGGLEFLEVLDRLAASGIREWSAVLVGRLGSFGDRASRTTAADRERAMSILSRLSGLVSHHESLPRSSVLDEMRSSDFYVLPTLQDSFGYGALEAQACGAIVIASNVRALPEIVVPGTGLIVELPLDVDGEVHHRAAAMPAVKDSLRRGLEAAVRRALALSTQDRMSMARAAQARLAAVFGAESHKATIDRLYREALGIRPA